ncbi:fumarylacetoacetate hydrolase family protein [Ideonella sp. DXS29W]|uniref:Fumarylacetoacetate hydrolase family protein n=1 Tax=Ideonella lacteola TaxID=2984193 RepID=A0ABU9BYX4_9BURK
MRLLAFADRHGQPALGARLGDELVDLTAAGLPATLDELLRQGPTGFEAARAVLGTAPRRPVAGITHLPPLQHPGKALAVGLNYRDHAAESGFELPKFPVVFQRYPSSWVAHGQALVRPRASEQLDYEAELVAVIGRAGRHIHAADALAHVAGYSVFNDGSIRDRQLRTPQWLLGKNFDATGAFGPEFVTADELPPGASGLRIQCRLNGQALQDGNTADMVFDVAALVAACSEVMTLQPGDMIITGTPAGVGMGRRPPVWMKAGDVCDVEIEGIGLLRNPVVDEG